MQKQVAPSRAKLRIKKMQASLYRSRIIQFASIVILLIVIPMIFGWITLTELKHTYSRTLNKIIEDMHFLLPALLGVLILWNESRLKRDLHRKEIELNKRKFEYERKTREEHRKLIEREAESLQGVSSQLTKSIITQLTTDTSWASEALERAKLGPFSKTLFGERVGHFYDEKQYLAEHFLPHLLHHCCELVQSGKQVYLLIDSGTTLHPFFDKLGQAAINCHEDNEDWIDQVVVVTNNLPGVEALMDSGRLNPASRYSPLAINCQLLPGVPLPVYSAVLGELANKAIHSLKKEADPQKTVFIALVTGNWIRLRRSTPVCPVPLARGEGHLQFKQALIDCSDEIYVVTPLGKIFANISLSKLNQAMGFKEEYTDPDKKPYEEVHIADEKAKAVKIVSTSRDDGRLLHTLSIKVQAAIEDVEFNEEQVRSTRLASPNHVLLPFDRLPDNWYLELETEFPHRYTRRAEFRETYFFVPPHPPKSRSKGN